MSRTRSRDSRQFQPAYVDDIPATGTPRLNVPNWGTHTGTIETMTDNVNPGFRKLMQRGVTVMSPCFRSKTSFSGGNLNLNVPNVSEPGRSLRIHGCYGQAFWNAVANRVNLNPPYVDQDRMVSLALTRAYAKAKEPVICGGEHFSELEKTADMFHRPFAEANKLLRKMYQFRKLRIGKTSLSLAKASASTWLEYRYGWKPLILDSQAIYKELREKHTTLMRRTLVARASEKYDRTTVRPFTDANDGGILLSGSATIADSLVVSAGVRFTLDENEMSRVARIMGGRTSDILPTIWELTPYSFVADWFANIGDFLQAIVPVPGFSTQGNWVTGVHNQCTTLSGNATYGPWAPLFLKYTASFSNIVQDINNYSRAVNQPMPNSPVLTRKTLSTLHTVDAVSLVCQRLLSGIRDFKH